MKLKLLIALSILLALLIALAVWWDPIIDFLPIDQSGWKNTEQGWFYLDEDGDPLTGWQVIGSNRYYFDPASGTAHFGWLELQNRRYYFDGSGCLITDRWYQDAGSTYYLGSDGAVHTGWLEEGGTHYYLNSDGTPAVGWKTLENTSYFFLEDGTPHSGWLEYEGNRYYFREDGTLATGWLDEGEHRYYLGSDGSVQTGWAETSEGRFYLGAEGFLLSGWQEIDGDLYYLNTDGRPCQGWLNTDQGRYYLDEDGSIHRGWLEEGGSTYYFLDDGTLAKGKQIIDGKTYYFTSTGANIVLVNPWNYLPDDYSIELTKLDNGHTVATVMVDALTQMLSDCEAAGHKPYLYSSYRTASHQQRLFNNMLNNYGGDRAKASRIVAVPGTSEHQLGLAVDITDFHFRELNSKQEKTDTQKWLMEHCWDYGFILRYPNNKSSVTGIIYEPWHYRYVGLELAAELKDSGICLEEYLDQLTGDGTTCGGGNAS